jgi:LacI family transcriptional regulator
MSNERLTLEEVAREAGVSLATADRVINRRQGVRAKTVAQVERAISKLGYRTNAAAARLARNRRHRFAFVLPSSVNPFMEQLAAQASKTAEWLELQQAYVDVLRVDVFDPAALAAALRDLPHVYDGVAVVALDHPAVRAAIDDLTDRSVHVVTLVSDTPSSRRAHYVGIDNPAAGRTAASLMGRFLARRPGHVAVIVGSMALRDHSERHFGFLQVLSGEYPHLQILPALEGRDDPELNEAIVASLLRQSPDLVGIYNVGAGNEGIVAALENSGRAGDLVWIAHELTPKARRWLMNGHVDAIINQDAGHEVRSAARILLARCERTPILLDQERIRIEIFLRDNLP